MTFTPEIRMVASFIIGFFVCYFAIPSIIVVSKAKHLYDRPEERKAHTTDTPTLGGLAIFAAVLLSIIICTYVPFYALGYLIGAMTVMFFVGLKDDILVIAPWTKMSGQVVAGLILCVIGDVRFTSLHGFYGITNISYIFSIILSLFVYIVIVNALNLIDGIDGLCAGIATLVSITFGIWFYLVGKYQCAILSAALIGSLVAFFRFNVFSARYKIFMGDTGSLIIGTIIFFLAIRFNEINTEYDGIYKIHAAPAVSFGILIVPLFDMLRVMFIRLIIGKSPFNPDKNHIHHKLLDLGFSHKKATFTILFANIGFIFFSFLVSPYVEILRLMLLLMILAMGISYIPVILCERNEKRILKQKEESQTQENAA